ncbi:MAG TPA: ABC transporter permease [Actinomycetota bacterium]|nr:ABC transporter permease [Actinomycetota bacterium]
MYRLGIRLTLRSGREAGARLILTMFAVAIGVAVLLAVMAGYHAYQVTSNRPSWESTAGGSIPSTAPATGELWNYSENLYKGQFIETLVVATYGPGAPTVPGLPAMPGPGQFYTSPALSTLLKTVPASQLGDRFPGTQLGTIGQAGLSGPTELVIVIGETPAQLAALPNTSYVTRVATAAEQQGTTQLYRMGFGVGAILLLFPLLILVNTATRLAAARREERFAAMRLVGATPHQINVIASVEAVVGAFLGALVGAGVFLALRPLIAGISLSGARFFESYVTPTPLGYTAMIVGVPIASGLASLGSLRRVRITPLGVRQRQTPPPPRAWRVIPLLAGLGLFAYVVTTTAGAVSHANQPGHSSPSLLPIFLDLILIMVGLVLAGSWLTMMASRLLSKVARGGSSLLAARHLADNPKGSFRAVSGLVIAVFVGTAIAGLAPADIAAQSGGAYATLDNVLRVNYSIGIGPKGPGIGSTSPLVAADGGGLTPAAGAALVSSLDQIHGISVIPIYTNPAFVAYQQQAFANAPVGPDGGRQFNPNDNTAPPPDDAVITCADLAALPAFGSCPAGATAVQLNASGSLQTDNPLEIAKALPLVTTNSAPVASVSGLEVEALMVKAANADALETARTMLTNFNAAVTNSGDLRAYQMGDIEPETFGEIAAVRNNDDNNLNRVVLLGTALTILVAGCSLAVSVGGSLVERRRPFSLLRVSGTQTSVLGKAVFLESGVPLIVAALVAAAAAIAVVIPLVNAFYATVGVHLAHGTHPGGIYYVAIGSGLAFSMGVILLTLPLLGRMTLPANARFE